MNVLLTGISGFVGHHIFAHLMRNTDWHVIGMHRSSYAGDLHRLDEVIAEHPEWGARLTLLHHDLRDPLIRLGRPPLVLHVAASSHVDRSIENPLGFLRDNVEGTLNLLEWARDGVEKFVYFSTDEVYGNAPDGVLHREDFAHRPRNPYAASKAAAEDFCHAYHTTYGVPVIVTNTMNIIGERQHAEKYVPLCIRKILAHEKILIHAHPDKQRAGQRHYLHARNAAAALLYVVEHGKIGERYNIVGEMEMDNLQLAREIYYAMPEAVRGKKLHYELVDFHSARPGHDLRYALDGSKLRGMGYTHPVGFLQSLQRTVRWTLDHPKWLQP